MTLWSDPLDELIAELERTLPSPPAPEFRPLGLSFVELQFKVAEIMRTSPRVPIDPDPSDDREAAEPQGGPKATP